MRIRDGRGLTPAVLGTAAILLLSACGGGDPAVETPDGAGGQAGSAQPEEQAVEPVVEEDSTDEDAGEDAEDETAGETPAEPEPQPGEILGDPVDPNPYSTTDVNGLGEQRWAFETPSGRHHCVILPVFGGSDYYAGCLMDFDDIEAIAEQAWGAEGHLAPGGPVPTVDSAGAQIVSVSDTTYGVTSMGDMPVLKYGEVLEVEGVSCAVAEEGITCAVGEEWMLVNGAGYEFSTDNT